MHALDPELATLLASVRGGRVLALTGAGISAESGIPTFRGQEGYWTVGSREYHPQEMATQATFRRLPREVWRWYLYRRGVCRRAGPNDAHRALARLEQATGDRFHLATQNVDGLHLQAGNSLERTFQVHGNIDFFRAADGSSKELHPLPDEAVLADRDTPLTDELYALLQTPEGAPARPHVLWFDEYYDEELYRSGSAMAEARRCDLLLVVGSSGAASLPMHVTAEAARSGAAIVDVNPGQNPFGEFARDHARGCWLEGPAATWLPRIVDALVG